MNYETLWGLIVFRDYDDMRAALVYVGEPFKRRAMIWVGI